MEQTMIVTVQFTGNAKTYDYVVIGDHPVEAVEESAGGGKGVCRVVVPGKVKDDGQLSLSIANVISHRWVPRDEALGLKLYPVVAAIPAKVIDFARLAVVMIDVSKAPAA